LVATGLRGKLNEYVAKVEKSQRIAASMARAIADADDMFPAREPEFVGDPQGI